MAIITTFSENGLLKTSKSDNNKYIRKVGTEEVYTEATDLTNKGFEYEELDEDIVYPDMDEINNIIE